MNKESLQHSLPLNNPVDRSVAQVLRLLDAAFRSADCEYFVAGATARDLILVNLHGLRPGRATRDIDFGIAVESWEQFELLKERLIATREFVPTRGVQQRLMYTDRTAASSMPVDLIPFRGAASDDGTIAWPPNRDIVMNVAGFEEALKSSISIQIEEGLAVRVASVSGLTLLKLTAWADRGMASNKDASDLYRLFTSYAGLGNEDRLYNQEIDLLETVGFSLELAGAELLGRDVASVCGMQVLDQVRSLLASEHNRERLVNHMVQTSVYTHATPAVEEIVNGFWRGFMHVH